MTDEPLATATEQELVDELRRRSDGCLVIIRHGPTTDTELHNVYWGGGTAMALGLTQIARIRITQDYAKTNAS